MSNDSPSSTASTPDCCAAPDVQKVPVRSAMLPGNTHRETYARCLNCGTDHGHGPEGRSASTPEAVSVDSNDANCCENPDVGERCWLGGETYRECANCYAVFQIITETTS